MRCYAAPHGIAADQNLPDIGSPADTVLSKDIEAQIGRQIYKSLRDADVLVTDPEIQEYVQDLGQKLAANAQDGTFSFQVLHHRRSGNQRVRITRRGYIGIHSGLLLATKSESELAGVLAHEISHVTQRHISRAVFANQRASILTMAAMLGAILLGAVGGSGDVVTGAVAAAQSVSAQQQINFTRANEYEADRVGVGVLASSGFDPYGMPDFFETLGRQSGPSAGQAPEFLRTHPVTVNRIAETRSRAANYPDIEAQDAPSYSLTRARLRSLGSTNPGSKPELFRQQERRPLAESDDRNGLRDRSGVSRITGF